MYTQKYSEGDARLYLPENYSGNAIMQNERISLGTADIKKPTADSLEVTNKSANEAVKENKNPWENEDKATDEASAPTSATPSFLGKLKGLGGMFDGISMKALLGKKSDSAGTGLWGLGIEEIMLIAIAAVLFFSKNGDKECALILLLLLLID